MKKRIYSVRTQYSIAIKATIIFLKNQRITSFKTTTKASKSSPPYSTDPRPSGANKASVASDPSPTPSLPDKAQRVAPDLTASPALAPDSSYGVWGAEGAPTRGAGPAVCHGALPGSYLGGYTPPQRKCHKLWLAEQGSCQSLTGAGHSPRNVPGRRGGFHR